MKVGIYNHPSVGGVNGVEYSVVTLAEALARGHDVDIIHHNEDRTRTELDQFYGCDLAGVRLRCLPRVKLDRIRNPWRRYRASEHSARTASAEYDLFVSFSGTTPPYCHARRGVLMVIFPFHIWQKPARDMLHRLTRPMYEAWELRRNLRSYDVHTSNSDFTAHWTRRRWGVRCQTVYAPADIDFAPGSKVNRILSVGRFATLGTCKNQRELMQSFRELSEEVLRGWSFVAVGPVGRADADTRYFQDVNRIGAGHGGEARADVDHDELKALYETSKIFWHAAGFGVDAQKFPDNLEHFGIVTVEAMAAGCVPIVIDRGGQSEIVQHGQNGFVWRTLDELKECTRQVVEDEELRTRLSAAARKRAQRFGKQAFVERFMAAVGLDPIETSRGEARTHVRAEA
jgi:glycosyltransferase involved in cell wall biosynthesis